MDRIPEYRDPERRRWIDAFITAVFYATSAMDLSPPTARAAVAPGHNGHGAAAARKANLSASFRMAASAGEGFPVTDSSPGLAGRPLPCYRTGHMGLADRDYQRNAPPGGGGFMARLTPVVKWLLIANIGVFVLDYLVLPLVFGLKIDDRYHLPPILNWGAFTVKTAILEMRLWEFVTFQFLHGSLGHVLFNSIGIFFFGPWMERWWGSKKFLLFYLLCGIAGAAFFTLLLFLKLVPGDLSSPLVGASAGIYGIFIGVAFVAPNLRVMLLFPPIELSMRQLAIALMVISIGVILLSIGGNEGGEAGHLGGAILGFILMRFPWLLGGDPRVETIRPGAFGMRGEPKLRPRSRLRMDEDDAVDRILDKVYREGFQSLTQAERDTLQQASERQKSDP